jgi:hypothetical protein
MFDRMRASVKAVATSPSVSTYTHSSGNITWQGAEALVAAAAWLRSQ